MIVRWVQFRIEARSQLGPTAEVCRGTPLPGRRMRIESGILRPPTPHRDRFATPTSFGLIARPTLRRRFKRLAPDLCSGGVRPLRILSDGAGGFLPGAPLEPCSKPTPSVVRNRYAANFDRLVARLNGLTLDCCQPAAQQIA
jgi:hypothetical protein